MSKLNKAFTQVEVSVPDFSGFDLSHEVLSSALTGQVTPLSWMEVLPNDVISCGGQMKVTLPPMSVPFMGRIDAEITAAFIPYRLIWQGWKAFIMQNTGVGNTNHIFPSQDEVRNASIPSTVPLLALTSSDTILGTLAEHLGFRNAVGGNNTAYVNALPFLAYHKFCDDWIRVPEVTKPFFPEWLDYVGYRNNSLLGVAQLQSQGRFLPYSMYASLPTDGNSRTMVLTTSAISNEVSSTNMFNGQLNNLVDTSLTINSMRQRAWAKDYFTTATTRPQMGAESAVEFDTSGSTGSISIASIRSANSLQKWRERNNIAGAEYDLMQLAHWGCTPPDAALNRSLLLGSIREPVYVGSIEGNNEAVSGTAQYGGSNPYGTTMGSAAGFASSYGKGSLIDNFHAKEYGIIMFFFTLIPHAYYSSGVRREFMHTKFGDFAWPEMANVGDQEIWQSELNAYAWNEERLFGFAPRYSEYKFMPDVVSGVLNRRTTVEVTDEGREVGVGMDVYALQRYFSSTDDMQLNSSFVEIPTNFLDQVTNVNIGTSGWSCLIDAFFDAKALRVLPQYSLPSLN